ncbi:MAG TPA: hypothetical protein VGD30_07440 [Telluria sp.]
MAQFDKALRFIQTAVLPHVGLEGAEVAPVPGPSVDLNHLPAGLVSGNTLIDYSAAPATEIRSAVSLAMLFAGRTARAAMNEGDDEDDWFAAYTTHLSTLGFSISQSSVTASRFKKEGLFVHKAIIPFLTIALGGAIFGPVILAALENLKSMEEDKPWITLFDRESRQFKGHELQFAAVSSDTLNTSIRHVVARLAFVSNETNVLFFRITKADAAFESATTTMTADTSLLTVLEAPLRARMKDGALKFIAEATLDEQNAA